ncbi:MAG: efflux RND transporter periplasmic adaptor subunit [Eubacteriales bacterium]|nr:efflux RND transporter periplasmic adaptor subunit [Eubacteriales bacterium]
MFKKKKKRIIIGIIIVIIILVIVLAKIFTDGEMPTQVSTGSVEKMNIEQAVSIKGTIRGSESADVTSSLNYEIVSILVKEGDIVKKDQVLAILDAGELQSEYKKAVRTLEETKFSYEASKLLYNEGAISKEEYIKTENAYENAKITVDSYNISEKTKIKSPISGTVTRVNVNLGRYANDTENNQPMFVIEDLKNLKMDVKISEYDINKINVGQTVIITSEVLGSKSVEGIVSGISPTGEPKDAASKEMVIPVQIDVIKGDTDLIAGVTAKARIQIEKREDVLSVPIDSILQDPDTDESFVMSLDGTIIKKVPVGLGIEGDFHVEIVSGDLSEGDKVVLSPTFDMTDGMEVIPLP